MARIKIRQTDRLTDDQHRQLFEWGENIFGTAHLGLVWRPKDVHFLLYADDCLASHAALLTHTIRVNSEPATVAGLGGVVTPPSAQRQGFARVLVIHAMDVLRQSSVDGGLLFCIPRMVAYYEALGWVVVDAPVFIEQPGHVIESPVHVMVLPLTARLQRIERIDLLSQPW